MSIEEKDKAARTMAVSLSGSSAHSGPKRKPLFINRWLQRPEPDLTKPLGALHWPLAITGLLCSVAVVLLFARIIDLGSIRVGWMLTFNVNMAVALVVLMLGVIAIVPKAIKNPLEWRNRNTIISFVVLALVAVFFLVGFLNLGIFIYTLDTLDVNWLCIAALAVVLVWLAFKGSVISVLALLGVFLWWGFSIEGLSWDTFGKLFTSQTGESLLRTMIPPNWTYFSHVINPMLVTIQTAIVATVIGIIGALPLSILAARNTTPHPVIYNIVRLFVNTIRAIPALVLALVFITFIGLGPVPGAFGLGLHTISVLTKLYAEAIESVKPQPLEALSAAGANGLKRFRWGVFPQVFPLLASSSIYYWESNTRDATVVAFVGGGGIGFILNANLSLLDYANVSVILISLVLTVALLDRISDFVRSKII